MKIDLHLHSMYSWDSKVKIEDYINKAEKMNFSAISITDHNNITSHSIIRKLQSQTDVLLIPGQEISTLDGHLLAYGWIDQIEQGLSMKSTVQLITDQNGYAIAAHPFDPFRNGSFSKIFQTDILGFEILNASAWFGFPNWFAKRAHYKNQSYAGVGNSDSHRIEEFGSAYTKLPDDIPITISSLFENLVRGEVGGKRIGVINKLKRLIKRKIV